MNGKAYTVVGVMPARIRRPDCRRDRRLGADQPHHGPRRQQRHQSLPDPDRPPPFRCIHRAGPVRARWPHAPTRRAVSQHQGRPGPDLSPQGGDRRLLEPVARDHAGWRRAGPDPGLRQHRQPAPGPELRAGPRVRRALGAGRRAGPPRAAAPDGEPGRWPWRATSPDWSWPGSGCRPSWRWERARSPGWPP